MSNHKKVYTLKSDGWDQLLGGGLISDDILCIMGAKSFPKQEFLLRLLEKLMIGNTFIEDSLIIFCSQSRLSGEATQSLNRLLKDHKKQPPALALCQGLSELFALLNRKKEEQKKIVAIFLDDLAAAIEGQSGIPIQDILMGLHDQADLLVYTDTFDSEQGLGGDYFNSRQNRPVGEHALVLLKAGILEERGGAKSAILVNVDTEERIAYTIDRELKGHLKKEIDLY